MNRSTDYVIEKLSVATRIFNQEYHMSDELYGINCAPVKGDFMTCNRIFEKTYFLHPKFIELYSELAFNVAP